MNIISNTYDNTFYVEATIKNNVSTTLQYNYQNRSVKLINLTLEAKSAYTSNQKVSIQSDSIPNIILYQS